MDELTIEVWRAAARVAPTFDREEWTWRESPSPPSIPEIAAEIGGLLRLLKGTSSGSLASGSRLLVRRDDEMGVGIYLQVGSVIGEAEKILENFEEASR